MIRVVHSGSRIRMLTFSHPGSRGQKGTQSRIPDPVPEIIDPVFAKTSQNARFLLSENERFGLVFVKTGSINSGTEHWSAALSLISNALTNLL
jgi:hypothetical protein